MKKQHGNALFLILIAVALFAALSYAITQSGRGGGSISKEQARIDAAQIVQTVGEIEQGFNKMMLLGTAASDIVVGTAGGSAGWGEDNGQSDFCSTGTDCLFAPEGGGVTSPQVPHSAFDTSDPVGGLFNGPHSYNGIAIETEPAGYQGGVEAGKDTKSVLVFPLTQAVCAEINRGLGISEPMTEWTSDVDRIPGMGAVHTQCAQWSGYYLYYSVLASY